MYKKVRTIEGKKKYLGSPRTESVKNPVAMKALHQLRHLMNALIREDIIDDKTKINLELAREMNDANVRAAIKSWQDDRDNENKEYEKILIELFQEINKKEPPKKEDIDKVRIWAEQLENDNNKELLKIKKKDIEKYKLWKQQKGICVYTGKQISLSELFNGTSYDNHYRRRTCNGCVCGFYRNGDRF